MLLLIVACEEKPESTAGTEMETAEIPNVDEDMTGWRDAWNANDAQSLKDYAADDAVLLMWGRKLSGDSLNTWMDSTAFWMRDLRTTAFLKEVKTTLPGNRAPMSMAAPEMIHLA